MKKITSILLTLFFLVSSSHLSFATHFCGGHDAKHALLVDANDFGCGMEDEITHEETDECNVQNKCCDTESIDLSIQDSFQLSVSKDVLEYHFIMTTVASILFTIPLTDKNVDLYPNYQPPLYEKDIPVLFQSFLI
tara:strand:+ start:8165 stop:8572 length:408 start_codon:yes stop_codon:yes gene_type:complete